jgi:iron(III) transport system permease protein
VIRTVGLKNQGSLIGVAILFVLILYPLATLLIQIVFPNVFAVQMSFRPQLAPVLSALTDKLNVEALANSITIGIGGAILATAAGTVTAFAAARGSKAWRVFIEMSVWVVFFAPSYVIAQGWVVLMQDGGVFAQLFGLHNGWSTWFFSRFGLALVMGLKYFPFVHIAVVQAIQNLGGEFAMAGRMNGATPRQVFFKITLPLMTPALLAGMSIAFAEGFGDFGFAAAITPETHMPLVTYQIYQALSEAPVDYSTAALMSLLLIIVTAGALWLQFWWTGRRSYVTVSAQSRTVRQHKAHIGTTLPAALIALLAVVLPVGGSILVSLWRVWTNGLTRGNWTLHHYGKELNLSSPSMHALYTSLIYGLGAAIVTSAVALFLGYQLTYKTSRVSRVINVITMASLAIPGIVLAAGFVFAWNASWMHAIGIVLYGTPLCLEMAYIAGAIPYSIRLQHGAMSQLSPNLMTAAQLFGARQWRVVLSIVLPLVSSTTISTFFMTFTHTIFELPASMMLYPAGMPTFSVQTNEQFSKFNWASGSALTIIGVVIVFASYLIGKGVSNRVERRLRAGSIEDRGKEDSQSYSDAVLASSAG